MQSRVFGAISIDTDGRCVGAELASCDVEAASLVDVEWSRAGGFYHMYVAFWSGHAAFAARDCS
jgi:hypothetical protein